MELYPNINGKDAHIFSYSLTLGGICCCYCAVHVAVTARYILLLLRGICYSNDIVTLVTVEKNERCDDVDELHNLCNKLRLAIDQEADARYEVDRSLEAFK